MVGMDIPDEAVEAARRVLEDIPSYAHTEPDAIREIIEAAAPYMLAEAFAYGWREGAGIAAPVDLDTGEPMHDQAAQPACNPYRSQP